MTDKQPAALETKNERSESKPNTAKRYKTEKAELRRRIVSIVLLLVFVPAVIAVGMLEFNDRYYYITASLIIICSFIPFLMLFEKRRPRARELVVIAVMTALGVAGRAAFYMLPQFTPAYVIRIAVKDALKLHNVDNLFDYGARDGNCSCFA